MDTVNLFNIVVTPKGKLPQITYICDNYSFDGNMLFMSLGKEDTYVVPRENILFYTVSRVQAEPRTWNGQKIAEQRPVENILLSQQSPTVSREVEE